MKTANSILFFTKSRELSLFLANGTIFFLRTVFYRSTASGHSVEIVRFQEAFPSGEAILREYSRASNKVYIHLYEPVLVEGQREDPDNRNGAETPSPSPSFQVISMDESRENPPPVMQSTPNARQQVAIEVGEDSPDATTPTSKFVFS